MTYKYCSLSPLWANTTNNKLHMNHFKVLPNLINFLAFKLGWIAAVFGAIQGMSWLGPTWILLWVTAFFFWQNQKRTEWILLLGAAAIGYSLDSLLVLIGSVQFPTSSQLDGPAPLWMVAMWLNMAASLRYSLGWMRNRYLVGALLGMILGPAAYLAGEKLGGINLIDGVLPIAIEWFIAIPLLLFLERISRSSNLSNSKLTVNEVNVDGAEKD